MVTSTPPKSQSNAVLPSGASLRIAPASNCQRPDRAIGTVKRRHIRLLVVDDHPVVRKGIISCLARHSHFDVVGEASDGHEALQRARELSPDILLMDIEMPRVTGLVAAEILHKEMPQVKVLILSMHSQTEYVLRIIQSGASGYVLKDTSPDELAKAIDMVMSGEAFFSPDVARVALNQFVRGSSENPSPSVLTCREREVLIQIAEGLSNKEIANYLSVGVRTVETHRERIMRKLNIHSVAGLTKFAIVKGLIRLPEQIEA